MNRCKQCGQEIWESETTCAGCEQQSTALVLRNNAPAAWPSSHAGETRPAVDKVEPKPAPRRISIRFSTTQIAWQNRKPHR